MSTHDIERNGKKYVMEWNEESISITETGDPEETEMLETYDFARIEE